MHSNRGKALRLGGLLAAATAAVDGASGIRTFTSIVLPIVRNGVATTATLVFLIVWGEFLYAVNWSGLMALAVITSLPILALFLFTYRLLKEVLTVGAVK